MKLWRRREIPEGQEMDPQYTKLMALATSANNEVAGMSHEKVSHTKL